MFRKYNTRQYQVSLRAFHAVIVLEELRPLVGGNFVGVKATVFFESHGNLTKELECACIQLHESQHALNMSIFKLCPTFFTVFEECLSGE